MRHLWQKFFQILLNRLRDAKLLLFGSKRLNLETTNNEAINIKFWSASIHSLKIEHYCNKNCQSYWFAKWWYKIRKKKKRYRMKNVLQSLTSDRSRTLIFTSVRHWLVLSEPVTFLSTRHRHRHKTIFLLFTTFSSSSEMRGQHKWQIPLRLLTCQWGRNCLGDREPASCLNLHLITDVACRMCSAAARPLSALFVLSCGSLWAFLEGLINDARSLLRLPLLPFLSPNWRYLSWQQQREETDLLVAGLRPLTHFHIRTHLRQILSLNCELLHGGGGGAGPDMSLIMHKDTYTHCALDVLC